MLWWRSWTSLAATWDQLTHPRERPDRPRALTISPAAAPTGSGVAPAALVPQPAGSPARGDGAPGGRHGRRGGLRACRTARAPRALSAGRAGKAGISTCALAPRAAAGCGDTTRAPAHRCVGGLAALASRQLGRWCERGSVCQAGPLPVGQDVILPRSARSTREHAPPAAVSRITELQLLIWHGLDFSLSLTATLRRTAGADLGPTGWMLLSGTSIASHGPTILWHGRVGCHLGRLGQRCRRRWRRCGRLRSRAGRRRLLLLHRCLALRCCTTATRCLRL